MSSKRAHEKPKYTSNFVEELKSQGTIFYSQLKMIVRFCAEDRLRIFILKNNLRIAFVTILKNIEDNNFSNHRASFVVPL